MLLRFPHACGLGLGFSHSTCVLLTSLFFCSWCGSLLFMFRLYLDMSASVSKVSHWKAFLWHYTVERGNRGLYRPSGNNILVILPLTRGSDKRKCESFLNPGLGACNCKGHSYHLFSVKNGFRFNAECLANTVDAEMCPICSAVRNSDVMVAHFPGGSIRNWECSCHTGV